MTDKYILLVDNDPLFLKTYAELLSAEGYIVLQAGNLEQARRLLNDNRLHLAILDIRMIDDDDELDKSGLELAKEKAFAKIPKIIMTNYPVHGDVRKALVKSGHDVPPAVDFVYKKLEPQEFVAAVAQSISSLSFLDSKVQFRLNGLFTFGALAQRIDATLCAGELGDERAKEIEDLFRNLFHDCEEVILTPLGQGTRGAAVLQASPFSASGPERQLVVKVGRRPNIERERDRYETFVRRWVGAFSTQLENYGDTLYYAAIAYGIVGGDLERTKRFTDYYLEKEAPSICTALDHLFSETCKLWLQQQPNKEPARELVEVYRQHLDLPSIAIIGESLNAVCEEIHLHAHSLEIDSLIWLAGEHGPGPRNINFEFRDGFIIHGVDPAALMHSVPPALAVRPLLGITHGDLTGDNIRVALDGRVWLTDFEQTDWGPVLLDFVQLETVIKFHLVRTTRLGDLARFEQSLLNPYRLDAPVETSAQLGPDLQKATQIIAHLRKLASSVMGADIRRYYLGLMMGALQVMLDRGSVPAAALGRPKFVRQAHTVLSSALIARRLLEWNEELAARPAPVVEKRPAGPASIVEIDAAGDVWVHGKKLEPALRPKEFALLQYLISKPNTLCSREELIKILYPNDEPGAVSDDAINTQVERLRKRIEPENKRPKYVITVRGRGYRLQLP